MDLRLTALIAISHVRLRQEMLARYPHLVDERVDMAKLRIPMPIELAGMKAPLARAEGQEKAIAKLGERYGAVQDKIDELIEAHADHAFSLEAYEDSLRRKIMSMVAPTNGGDPLDDGTKAGQTGQPSPGADAKTDATEREAVTVKAEEVAPVATVVGGVVPTASATPASIEAGSPPAQPEHLTVNGVSTS